MASRNQRAPLQPKTYRVPKAALGLLKGAQNRLREAQEKWQEQSLLVAAFLDVDLSKIENINLETGEVRLKAEEPTPMREDSELAPTG